jgi:hypothetical protein
MTVDIDFSALFGIGIGILLASGFVGIQYKYKSISTPHLIRMQRFSFSTLCFRDGDYLPPTETMLKLTVIFLGSLARRSRKRKKSNLTLFI